MNKEQIFEAIGDIDEQYIHEAQVAVKKKTRPIWVKWGAIAASVCLACVGGVVAYNISQSLTPEWVGESYALQRRALLGRMRRLLLTVRSTRTN